MTPTKQQRPPSLHRFSIWLWCIFMIRLRISSRFCRTCCLGNQLSKRTGSSKCTTGFCRDKQTSPFKKIMQPFALISVFWGTSVFCGSGTDLGVQSEKGTLLWAQVRVFTWRKLSAYCSRYKPQSLLLSCWGTRQLELLMVSCVNRRGVPRRTSHSTCR